MSGKLVRKGERIGILLIKEFMAVAEIGLKQGCQNVADICMGVENHRVDLGRPQNSGVAVWLCSRLKSINVGGFGLFRKVKRC